MELNLKLSNKIAINNSQGSSIVAIFEDGTIYGISTVVNWGDISGTLSSQTDLWSALEGKLDSSIISSYATQSWVSSQGYITGISGADVSTALGYTPISATDIPASLPANGGNASSLAGQAATYYASAGALANYYSTATAVSSAIGLSSYATQSWVESKNYISGITGAMVSTALGYTAISANDLAGYATESWVLSKNYISGISSNDVTTALGYTPLSSYTEPVNADWSATTGLSSIKNKPTLGTAASMASTDFRASTWMPTYSDVGALSDDTFIPSTAADVNALPANINYTSKIILGIGGSEYAPSSGIITLPAYPTIPASLPANGGSAENAASLGGSAPTYYASSGHNHDGRYLSTSANVISVLGYTPISANDIPASLPANGGNASSLAGQSGAYYASAGALANYIPLTGTTSLSGGIFPQTTNTYDLGSTNNKFRSVYAREVFATFSVSASSVYTGDLYIGDSQIHKMYNHNIVLSANLATGTGNQGRWAILGIQIFSSDSTAFTTSNNLYAYLSACGFNNSSTALFTGLTGRGSNYNTAVVGLYASTTTNVIYLVQASNSASQSALYQSSFRTIGGMHDKVVPMF